MDEKILFVFDEYRLEKKIQNYWQLFYKDKQIFTKKYNDECLSFLKLLIENSGRFISENEYNSLYSGRMNEISSLLCNALNDNNKLKKRFIINKKGEGYCWIYTGIKTYSQEEKDKLERIPYLIKKLEMEGVEEFVEKYPEFVEELVNRNNLPKYWDVKNTSKLKEADFCVALSKITLKRNKDYTITANVFIPQNPYVAYDGTQRNYIERYPNEKGEHPSKGEIEDF